MGKLYILCAIVYAIIKFSKTREKEPMRQIGEGLKNAFLFPLFFIVDSVKWVSARIGQTEEMKAAEMKRREGKKNKTTRRRDR